MSQPKRARRCCRRPRSPVDKPPEGLVRLMRVSEIPFIVLKDMDGNVGRLNIPTRGIVDVDREWAAELIAEDPAGWLEV